MLEAAGDQAAHQAALAQKGMREAVIKRKKLEPPANLELAGIMTCYIQGQHDAVRPALARAGVRLLTSAIGAALIVVDDVAAMSADMLACVCLQGGVAAIPQVVSGRRCGPTRGYLPAVAVAREVWLSPGFCAESRGLAAIVKHLANIDTSKWCLLGSAEEFELAKREAHSKKRNATVLAVVSHAEKDAIAKSMPAFISRHALTWDPFLEFVARPDCSNWRDGLH